MRWYGEQRQPYRIEVVSYGAPPPESAVTLVRRVGGVITEKDPAPATGRRGGFPVTANGDLDWPALHAANADLFAQRHALPGTLDSLHQLDGLLADAHAAATANAYDDGDLPEDGDLAILAGAYASEVMLRAFGGSWSPPDEESHLPDLRIRLGPDGHLDVGVVAKVRKFLRNGPEDSVRSLAELIAERV